MRALKLFNGSLNLSSGIIKISERLPKPELRYESFSNQRLSNMGAPGKESPWHRTEVRLEAVKGEHGRSGPRWCLDSLPGG